MITEELVKEHNLSAEEYSRILEILGREPNLVELGIFSAMWSEHCSYKSSRIHLKKFPTTGPQQGGVVVDFRHVDPALQALPRRR